jgi:hypothetical protein
LIEFMTGMLVLALHAHSVVFVVAVVEEENRRRRKRNS